MKRGFLILLGFAVLAVPTQLLADPTVKKQIDFARDIFPIFREHCVSCHGPDEAEGQLRLDGKTLAFQGGVSGRLFAAGKSKNSLLYKRVAESGDHEQMPLDADPLSKKQIALIARWIDEGGDWPDGVGSSAVALKKHWAYVPPVKHAIPETTTKGSSNPIDRFIAARLEREGFAFSSTARLPVLVRRVYLDLIGLPPSVQKVDHWVERLKARNASEDINEQAWTELVDSLLASPRYGERWTRRWLDLARYADSNGYQADQYREVWPYRDWVIDAMNNDMPFDRFTIEQLAGDLLPKATTSQRIATGFSRLTTCNVEAGVDPEENRTNQVIDRVNTTATVWLGTTLECAQCHNHKYDPLSQRDYYQFFAYFNNTPIEVEGDGVTYNLIGPKMSLPLSEDQQARRKLLAEQLAAKSKTLAEKTKARKAGFGEWLAKVSSQTSAPPHWSVLEITDFVSSGGSSHELLADGSVLVSGKRPSKDNYTVTVACNTPGITTLKLEALTHDSLPGKGPGRHDEERPNFVLYEMKVQSRADSSADWKPVALHSATADFSQANWSVAGLIDGKPDTGWAINPQFGKDHYAVVQTKTAPQLSASGELIFEFDQHYGDCRTMGRFRLSATTDVIATSKLPANIAKLVAAKKRNQKQNEQLENYFIGLDPEVTSAQKEVDEAKKQLDAMKPTTSLVMIEEKPRETYIFKRGEFLNPGEKVSPGTPQRLTIGNEEFPPNRLGLARWITSPRNPLTARVAVNRWWGEFFGAGLVQTQEDFGTQGERPTHSSLLDWLAVDFMQHNWSRKHVHRTITMSRTYRQSSKANQDSIDRDADNRLLARGPRFRLPAETIRDNALAIAGLITHKVGGPPVYPPQPPNVWRHVGRNEPKYATDTDEDRYRRGLYVYWRRSAPYPSFINFDAPDRASCAPQRPRTNTPLQALTLLNDPAFVEAARALADRSIRERPESSPGERIEHMFRLAVARRPTEFEAKHLLLVYQQEIKNNPSDEAAALFFIANIILNLDETISKT